MQDCLRDGGKVLVVASPCSVKIVIAGLMCDGLPFSAAFDRLSLAWKNITFSKESYHQVG